MLAVARKYGLKVIEDACQAHGAEYKGHKVAQWEIAGLSALTRIKTFAPVRVGCLSPTMRILLKSAQSLWSFGETRTPSESRDYHVYAMGWMYRNNDLTAAFGRAQLSKLDGYLVPSDRQCAASDSATAGYPWLILPTEPEGFKHNWYNYVLRFDMA